MAIRIDDDYMAAEFRRARDRDRAVQLIWAASMVVLDASRRGQPVPRLAAWSLGRGHRCGRRWNSR